MSITPATLILAGVVSGIAAAAVTVAVISPAEDAAASGDAASAQELAAVRRLVQSVQAEQRELARRLQALQLEVLTGAGVDPDAGHAPAIEPLAASHEELSRLRAELATLSERVEGDDGTPFMIESVSDALETIRDREDEERREMWAQRQEQRNEERLEMLTEQLSLDGYQQEQMKQHMADYGDKRDDIMSNARESGDFAGLRDAFSGLRDEMSSSLTLFLTPSQITTMEGLESQRGMGGGFGRGGFGGR